MTEALVLQHTEDKPIAIKQVKPDTLSEQINKIFDSIAKRAYELFDATAGSPAMTLMTGSKLRWNCCIRYASTSPI